MMKTEILATGNEVLSGTVVDSNSAFVARKLQEAGMVVVRHGCVGDNPDELTAAILEIGGRSDLAVVTGGLGPTGDDCTAEAAARAAGVELKTDSDALDSIRFFFTQRQWNFSEANRKQALLPEGAECIVNPVGTAPGFSMTIGKCRFFFLPGVPREMRRMMQTSVLPSLRSSGSASQRKGRVISIFGLAEATVAETLTGFEAHFPSLALGLQACFPEIRVRLYAGEEDDKPLDAAAAWIRDRLGEKVLSEEGRSLEEVVGDLLRQQRSTVAVAESCTGGRIADLLTDVPGSSDYFLLAAVTYANPAKVEVLGVSPATLAEQGAVSESTAREMAAGIRRLAGSDYGISTTGIAGPTGGSPDKPVGTVCIGLATAAGVDAWRYRFTFDDRTMNKKMFAATALNRLRRALLQVP